MRYVKIFMVILCKGVKIMVTYNEYIVKRKKTLIDYLICILSPVIALALAYFSTGILLAIPAFSFLVPAAWLGFIWLSVKAIGSRNVEFEYLLTDCDLDVDKIINKSRRKRIISTYRKEIIVMAPKGSTNLPSDWESLTKIDVTSSPDEDDVYVLIVQQDTRKAVIFQPTQKMIDTMIMRNPRKVFKG